MSGNKKVIQRCVRTYPEGRTITTENLNELLKQGYVVVMCHEIVCSETGTRLEYIVEKEVENE